MQHDHQDQAESTEIKYAPDGKFPWAEMKVGDSFFVDDWTSKTKTRLRNGVKYWSKKTWRKFSIKSEPPGIRVTRVL